MIKHKKTQMEFNELGKKILEENNNKDNITKNKNIPNTTQIILYHIQKKVN